MFLVLECITDNTQGFWCIFCEYFWVHSEREDKARIIEGGQINDCLKPRWFWDTAVSGGGWGKGFYQKEKFNWLNQFCLGTAPQ